MNDKSIEIPEFNEDEPVYVYKKKLDQYVLSLKKIKYNLILEIINKILNKKYKSLGTIQKIELSKISANHGNSIFDEYEEKIMKHFKIEISKYEKINFYEKFVTIVSQLLEKIEFSLIQSEIKNGKIYYDVCNKPKKKIDSDNHLFI